MDTLTAKYYNYFALLRLLAFEPFLISLQIFPILQVFIIFIIQGIFFLYTMDAIFRKKIFSHWVFTCNFFINETFLFIFLCICCYISLIDARKIDTKKYERFQITVIVFIVIIAVINIFIFVANLIVSIKELIKTMKKKKTRKKELRKTFLENYNSSRLDQSRLGRGITGLQQQEEILERSNEDESEDEKERSEKKKRKDYAERKIDSGSSEGSQGSIGKMIRDVNRKSMAQRRESKMKRDFKSKLKEEEQVFSKKKESFVDIHESYIGDINPNIVVDEDEKRKKRNRRRRRKGSSKKEKQNNSDPKREDQQPKRKKRSKSDANDLF